MSQTLTKTQVPMPLHSEDYRQIMQSTPRKIYSLTLVAVLFAIVITAVGFRYLTFDETISIWTICERQGTVKMYKFYVTKQVAESIKKHPPVYWTSAGKDGQKTNINYRLMSVTPFNLQKADVWKQKYPVVGPNQDMLVTLNETVTYQEPLIEKGKLHFIIARSTLWSKLFRSINRSHQ